MNREQLLVTPRVRLLLNSIQDNEIQGKSEFSLIHKIDSYNLSTIDGETASEVASILYELILKSNLIVMERNTSTILDDNAILGLEAKVDPNVKKDFSFYNPSEQSYKIEWEQSGNGVKARLIGPKLNEHYSLRFEEEKTYPPKIIKQYSPAIKNNDFQVKEKGKAGKSITVIKETKNNDGAVIKTDLIGQDFYLPVHRIEIHGFVKVVQNNEISQQQDGTDLENENVVDNHNDSSNVQRQENGKPDELIWTDPGDVVK
ncbi:VanW family protein [Lederbergia citri]|uniref:VanW family protein n=1 Tax=Lederbergia citri TaxID=2833580 RepID=A0A942YFB2_9BACI|nr:VanW family protein [Lederbergia citri]MBS4194838.1 VanW family protein [Lederbergia citri]